MPRYSHVQQIVEQTKKPDWLRVRAATGKNPETIRTILRAHNLHTVCEEAHCPNVGECWGGGTATFMLMGDVCTRGCRFCMVKSGNPKGELDLLEPIKIAQAIAELQLKYVVITSVDRDDLPDGGAEHFASTIRTIKKHDPNVVTEVLIPDFRGDQGCIRKIVNVKPEVIAHNIETTAPLTSKIRDSRATYKQSLQVLESIKEFDRKVYSKTSIMLGLGETEEDIIDTMRDLREVDVDILTLGQYLSPSKGHIPVTEFVSVSRFEYFKKVADEMGFLYVASGPLVRSSYRAAEFFIEALIQQRGT